MIINGDALDVMAQMPDETVDLIVTDYPYQKISGGNSGANRPTGILADNGGRLFKHNDVRVEDWMPEVFRVLRSPAHVYVMTDETNRRRTEDAMLSAGFKIHQLLTWRKNNATPNRWYMKNQEYTFFGRKGSARTINHPGSKANHEFKNTVDRDHPTEKPVDLMQFYIGNSTRPGDVVFDPFCGSGSAGVAASNVGCSFVGVDIDPQYADVARRRMRETIMKTLPPAYQMLRDMLIASGEKAAIRAFKTAYERKRRPEIFGTGERASQDELWRLQATREALFEIPGGHSRLWEWGRKIDCTLIGERDGK